MNMMQRFANPRRFLAPQEAARVADAIGSAEKKTSAEIKLVVLGHCWTFVKSKVFGLSRRRILSVS